MNVTPAQYIILLLYLTMGLGLFLFTSNRDFGTRNSYFWLIIFCWPYFIFLMIFVKGDFMPTLTVHDRRRLLTPSLTCIDCKKKVSKDYCRQCDEFYSICACNPTISNSHVHHRNYYAETILHALQEFISLEQNVDKISYANRLLQTYQSIEPSLTGKRSEEELEILWQMEFLIWESYKMGYQDVNIKSDWLERMANHKKTIREHVNNS